MNDKLIIAATLIFVSAAVFYLNREGQKQEAIARQEEEKRQKELLQKQREEKMKDCYNRMIAISNEALNVFESLPDHLSYAEDFLNQAEIDFKERAFAPFWDSIEKAVTQLGRFDEGLNIINDKTSYYLQIKKGYDGPPFQFPFTQNSTEKLRLGENTSTRMKAIVRQAQRDFEFSTIYEQRKTNQILIAGFTNLAHALEKMTVKITDSITNLKSSVELMRSSLNSSLDSIQSDVQKISISNKELSENSIKATSESIKMSSKLADREKRIISMLDNIQRHRKPSIFNN